MLFMKAKVPFSPALVLPFGDLVWSFWRSCLALLASLFGPFGELVWPFCVLAIKDFCLVFQS